MSLAGIGFDSNMILPLLPSSLLLDVGYLFLVGSNILLLMVVQHRVVILDFSQEKMRAGPSTPPSCMGIFGQILVTLNGDIQEIFWCQED